MDIYGAFQLCAIGILAAPTTVGSCSCYTCSGIDEL